VQRARLAPAISERIHTAIFNNALRDILLNASAFVWGSVSPAIFGSLLESAINKLTQRKQGAHYTPEEAIQKVISPLFLVALYIGFEALKARKDGGRASALAALNDKIAALSFFDPACGAGNILTAVAHARIRKHYRKSGVAIDTSKNVGELKG
jgi:type I restriction-modification system DNA methylase subunit